MNISSPRYCLLLLSLVAWSGMAVAENAPAQSEAGDNATVSVTYQNPKDFTESKQAGSRGVNDDKYLDKLKAYLIKTATPMLQDGQQLDVTITDVDLAGAYEPWRGMRWEDVRVMRDIYPPRINLEFTLTDADGKVIHSGSRKLHSVGFPNGQNVNASDTDPLRYDKALLRNWLRKGPANW